MGDPLSALSVATSVVTFVDFACQLVASTRTIYRTGRGLSPNSATLETVTTDLNDLLLKSPAFRTGPQELSTKPHDGSILP